MQQRTPLFASMRRPGALLLCLLLAWPAGCGGARPTTGQDLSRGRDDRLYADTAAAYEACLAACSANTSLALVTRTGCLAGCEEARRAFPLTGRPYASRQDCLDAFLQQELAKQDNIRAMRQWCDAQWTHVHNRKGCYTATETFYAALDPAAMCDSSGAAVDAYVDSLNRTREAPAYTPPAVESAGHASPDPGSPQPLPAQAASGTAPVAASAAPPAETLPPPRERFFSHAGCS